MEYKIQEILERLYNDSNQFTHSKATEEILSLFNIKKKVCHDEHAIRYKSCARSGKKCCECLNHY